jgi:hypothetical protein
MLLIDVRFDASEVADIVFYFKAFSTMQMGFSFPLLAAVSLSDFFFANGDLCTIS